MSTITRRSALAALGAVAAAKAQETHPDFAQGPFTNTWESLRQYTVPDWFRDAKFGIWSCWGPQAVPEQGDWYARNMYVEGHRQYNHHVEHYGHPSKFGYKDIIPLFRGEKFDPESLISLYQKAGARYFFALAVHCDNFDLWNSRHHRWNAVQMGPERDVISAWRQAARKAGLKFGLSEHVWGTYNWFSTNKLADKQGPLAGVPYDGNDPKYRDFYIEPHPAMPKAWAEQGNEPVSWKSHWYARMKDLIDQHHPDLFYTDGGIPFDEWGRSLVAHYYNQAAQREGGKVDVVYTSKRASDCETGTCLLDLERGVVDSIWANPWQNDTCVGDWYYKREIRYKSPKAVIDLLVDVVARNGNLLLNLPLRGDGTLDDRELAILDEITAWMKVNGEAIHGTRPWRVLGGGPNMKYATAAGDMAPLSAGHFNENKRGTLTEADTRFVIKGKTLYAFVMGIPQSEAAFPALSTRGANHPGKILNVRLLGHSGSLAWKHDDVGLRIQLPAEKPCRNALAFELQLA